MSGIWSTIGNWGSNIGSWAGTAGSTVGDWGGTAWNTVGDWGGTAGSTVGDWGGNVMDWFGGSGGGGGTGGNLGGGIDGLDTGAAGDIVGPGGGILPNIGGGASSGGGSFGNWLGMLNNMDTGGGGMFGDMFGGSGGDGGGGFLDNIMGGGPQGTGSGGQGGGGWGDIIGSGMGYLGSQDQQEMNEEQMQMMLEYSDPYHEYRDDAAADLEELRNDPDAILDSEIYQAGRDEGLEAVNREMGATGNRVSGRRMAALDQAAMADAERFYGNEFDRRARLSGAYQQPASVGGMMNPYQQRISQSRQNQWNSLGYGLSNLFG